MGSKTKSAASAGPSDGSSGGPVGTTTGIIVSKPAGACDALSEPVFSKDEREKHAVLNAYVMARRESLSASRCKQYLSTACKCPDTEVNQTVENYGDYDPKSPDTS